MQLTDFLDLESIRIGVSAKTKRALLQQLGTIAAQRRGLAAEAVQHILAAREKIGTTGFGSGVAIPHGKVEGIDGVFLMVARLAEPIDYQAIDDQLVDLVFLILSSPDAGAEHLKVLATVSRVVRDPAMLAKLRGARSRDAFAAVLIGIDERDAA